MSNDKGSEHEKVSRLDMLEGTGGPGLDGLQGSEQDKGSRLEMLDEASLTRQPEEVRLLLYTFLFTFLMSDGN